MKPAPFVRHAPDSIDDALAILSEVAPDDGRVIAGGQTLIPTMALRLARPAHLVDINGVAELARVDLVDGSLVIGACVRHAAFHRPVTKNPLGALLSMVVQNIAHLPIRNRGTFCGSLVNADPASEWCLVSKTLGGVMTVRSVRGTRDVAAEDFLLGFMTTDLEPDELVVQVRLPLLPEGARFGFVEFSRRAGDFAQAMTLAIVETDERERVVTKCRIGVGGVEPVARRIPEAEAALTGRVPDADAIRAAAAAAAGAVEPVEGDEDGLAYKRDLVEAATARALEQAFSDARTGGA